MKIAFVVHDYHRGGGHSRYVAELACRFAKEHEVHVFANRIDENNSPGIHFHAVPAWRANALTTVLTFALPATFQIGRRFDIIHSQGFCGFRGNVLTGHICNRAWHRALKKLEGGVTAREAVFNAVASTLEYSAYRFARNRAVIAISKRVAGDLRQFYHCPAPIEVIHHGVDLQVFSTKNRELWRSEMRQQLGLKDDETVFLYVGDLRKGAAQCIQALAQLDSGQLVLVSRSRTDAYQRAAEQAGVRERVVFAGATDHVEKFYAASDAFLLPTPYDAFAMVVTEAMASGLPVIVSREAGASELIENRVNGLLLEDTASVGELANFMRCLDSNPQFAGRLGAAARKTVEPMSWDAVAERTMRVYQQVLGGSN